MAAEIRHLTPVNALVTTAQVEIRMLSLGKKQVTLSVFRQIPYRDILAEDGTLRAAPWGWVNYFWEGCGRWGEEPLHVIWQDHDGLRRSCVPFARAPRPDAWKGGVAYTRDSPPGKYLHELRETFQRAVEDAFVQRFAAGQESGEKPYVGGAVASDPVSASLGSIKILLPHDDQALTLLADANDPGNYSASARLRNREHLSWKEASEPGRCQAEKERMRAEALERLRAGREDERTALELAKGADELGAIILAAWASSRAACEAAGQLFIAV